MFILRERMNELARNSVGEMASCLAGIAEQDLASGASTGEVDVQLLVKSLLWMFFHDGWIYAYPCPLSTSHFLEDYKLPALQSSKIPLPDPVVQVVAT
jgi:hypothetical protein